MKKIIVFTALFLSVPLATGVMAQPNPSKSNGFCIGCSAEGKASIARKYGKRRTKLTGAREERQRTGEQKTSLDQFPQM